MLKRFLSLVDNIWGKTAPFNLAPTSICWLLAKVFVPLLLISSHHIWFLICIWNWFQPSFRIKLRLCVYLGHISLNFQILIIDLHAKIFKTQPRTLLTALRYKDKQPSTAWYKLRVVIFNTFNSRTGPRICFSYIFRPVELCLFDVTACFGKFLSIRCEVRDQDFAA